MNARQFCLRVDKKSLEELLCHRVFLLRTCQFLQYYNYQKHELNLVALSEGLTGFLDKTFVKYQEQFLLKRLLMRKLFYKASLDN